MEKRAALFYIPSMTDAKIIEEEINKPLGGGDHLEGCTLETLIRLFQILFFIVRKVFLISSSRFQFRNLLKVPSLI